MRPRPRLKTSLKEPRGGLLTPALRMELLTGEHLAGSKQLSSIIYWAAFFLLNIYRGQRVYFGLQTHGILGKLFLNGRYIYSIELNASRGIL